jgi:hypothetical protein
MLAGILLPRQESPSAAEVEGDWGEGYPSPQSPALYYRVRTYLPDYYGFGRLLPGQVPQNVCRTRSAGCGASA